MLLELIFNVILNNIPDGRTHGQHPSSWAPVGAKNPHMAMLHGVGGQGVKECMHRIK